MAAYQPPTENLPKFNEFVFNQANSPEYLDQLVVHKAGTETITGQKLFTGDFGINNANTIITSSVQIFISSLAVFLNGIQNRIASNLSLASTSIGNKMDCQGGYNYITSATTSAQANIIEATGGGNNGILSYLGGSNIMRAYGTGNNSIRTLSGYNEMTTTSGDNIMISDTGDNNISTADGNNVITSTNGSNITQTLDGNNTFEALGIGSNLFTTATGTTEITSTTGQIKLETGALTNTGILIENTNTTTGGITIKANGSSGDILLSSVDNINITTSGTAGDILITSQAADVEITCGAVGDAIRLINGTTTKMTITSSAINVASSISTQGYFMGDAGAYTSPLVSFAITLYPTSYNTNNSQLSIGYPNADPANVNRVVRFPYRMKCVGWSVSGDAEAHSAVSLQLKITNQSGGAGGSIYYDQTGVLSANALQSSAAVCDLNGAVSGFSSAGAATTTEIPAGNNAFCWESTGGTNMLNEMLFVLFFQQVI